MRTKKSSFVSCFVVGKQEPSHRRDRRSSFLGLGVKASIVTTNARAPGGQFVLPPGRCLAILLPATRWAPSSSDCREIEHAYVDKGYRGQDAANSRRIFISGKIASASAS